MEDMTEKAMQDIFSSVSSLMCRLRGMRQIELVSSYDMGP